MAVPKQRHTKSRRDKRRMHLFIKTPTFILCDKCKKEKLPHQICWNCGFYKGKQVINVLEKLDKKERKLREKELSTKESEKAEKPLAMEDLSRK